MTDVPARLKRCSADHSHAGLDGHVHEFRCSISGHLPKGRCYVKALGHPPCLGTGVCAPMGSSGPCAVPSDVLERPSPQDRGEGDRPPLLPFQCLRLTAKVLLRRLRCQQDLGFKILAPPSAGTIGGPQEEGGSQPPAPFRPPL